MLFWAAAIAVIGVILKLIAADSAGWFLVPLAAAAGIYHVIVHARAARAANTPARLAGISDALLLAAILMQIDFSWAYRCGHTTYDGVAWRFGWSSEFGCTLITGLPALLLDLAFYIPVAITWHRLHRLGR